MRRFAERLPFFGLAAVCLYAAANAQTVLVHTTTLTAAREAVRVYTQAIDAVEGAPPLLPQLLPGETFAGPVIASRDRQFMLVTTAMESGALRPRQSYVTLSRTVPLSLQPQMTVTAPTGSIPRLHALVEDPAASAPLFVTFAESGDDPRRGPWQIRVRPIATQPRLDFAPRDSGWLLPGEPAACVVLPDRPAVAVLCRTPEGEATLHVRDVVRGEVLAEALTLPASAQDPAALAVSQDGLLLFAILSGYAPGGAARTSTLLAIDTQSFRVLPSVVELPGDAAGESEPLHPSGEGQCWAVTRSRSEGFAYAVLVETSAGLRKSAEYSFADAPGGLLMAIADDRATVAVAIGNRLELWPGGAPGKGSILFDSDIGALHWMGGHVLVGEAGCLHRVDPAAMAVIRSVQFQTGFVTGITLASGTDAPGDVDRDGLSKAGEFQSGTQANCADTDGDGLADGIDTEPTTRSPRLIVPSTVDFRGEGVGQELRAIRLESPYGETASWRLTVDSAPAPWLRVYPRTGPLPGWFLVGVDPARYRSEEHTLGTIAVSLDGTGPGTQATGSPRTLEVRVLPPRRNPRAILWLLDDRSPWKPLRDTSDPWRMKGLADVLAGPPYRFSHRVETRPLTGLPDDVTTVVLTAEAAERGVTTRQALLDFVSDGGSMLFLGRHLSQEGPRSLARWLSPIGVDLEPAVAVNGAFAAIGGSEPVRRWDGFRVADGLRMRVADSRAILVPDPAGKGCAVFAAGAYGNGRIALLASPTPLETASLQATANRLFAGELFTWLSEAGFGIGDLDADGLPDDVEDKNGNGVVDPGETDALNSDSDGDGIPDGSEDRSRNGAVDPGETSPLNPDSDGDGLFDGADPSPLPRIDAPHIDFLEPSRGPLEGGTRVTINGRNFPPSARVLFGGRPAPRVDVEGVDTLLVETPPAPESKEGAVDVRVENTPAGVTGVLPGGFAYTARSVVDLTFAQVSTAANQYDGVVALRVEAAPESSVGLLLVKAQAVPEQRFHWNAARAVTVNGAPVTRVVQRVLGPATLDLAITSTTRESIRGDIALISWQLNGPLAGDSVLKFRITEAKAFAVSGQPMDVSVGAFNLPLAMTPGQP